MEVNWQSNTANDSEKHSRHGDHIKTEKHFNIRTTFAARPENLSPGSSVRNAIIYSSR
jgi:hypothetical protein